MTIAYSGDNITFPDASTQNTAAKVGMVNRIINGAMVIDQNTKLPKAVRLLAPMLPTPNGTFLIPLVQGKLRPGSLHDRETMYTSMRWIQHC